MVAVITVSDIVRQRAHSGAYVVGINGVTTAWSAPCRPSWRPPYKSEGALTEHKRYPDRTYLLSGFVRCEASGPRARGAPRRSGKEVHYYVCRAGRIGNFSGGIRTVRLARMPGGSEGSCGTT